MPRKIIVRVPGGSSPILQETNQPEVELQELVKDNPDLLPVEEFGLSGPLLVVGRETTLPSGAVDLVALTPQGDLLIVEFKTGPKNTDFRAVIAQLLDYGSDLWGQTLSQFEQSVAVRYFTGPHCTAPQLRNLKSLAEAANLTWPLMSQQEHEEARYQLESSLQTGRFHYLVVAQRFTASVERTIDYLNATTSTARFYAIELVSFTGDGLTAFEARGLTRPRSDQSQKGGTEHISEDALLVAIEDERYRRAIQDFLELSSGLGLKEWWGTAGVSIRLQTPDRPEALSVGWIFPPGRAGWYGLTDVTLGYDPSSAAKVPSIAGALDRYVEAVGRVSGVLQPKSASMASKAWHVPPQVLIAHGNELHEALANLVSEAAQSTP